LLKFQFKYYKVHYEESKRINHLFLFNLNPTLSDSLLSYFAPSSDPSSPSQLIKTEHGSLRLVSLALDTQEKLEGLRKFASSLQRKRVSQGGDKEEWTAFFDKLASEALASKGLLTILTGEETECESLAVLSSIADIKIATTREEHFNC